jgi:hypothetical protein
MVRGYRIWSDRISTSYGTRPLSLKIIAPMSSGKITNDMLKPIEADWNFTYATIRREVITPII